RFRLQIVKSQLMVECSTELMEKMNDAITTLSDTNTKLNKTKFPEYSVGIEPCPIPNNGLLDFGFNRDVQSMK
ncbi:2327_t:CDS:2, partial [Funneliformis mosseae]